MKNKLNKYWKELMVVIIIILITISIFWIGQHQYINGKILKNITELIFGNLLSLIAIWISGYFILIQLYKNTYPMEIIEKNFLKKVKIILMFSIANILIGLLVLTKFNDFISRLYFIILFVFNVIIIFYNIYMINRTFTLNTYIDKYFKNIEEDLEKNILKKDTVDNIFCNIRKFFDECIIKEEYYVCNNISKKNEELFQQLIKHCNQLFLSGNKEEEELAKYIFNEIINSGCYQIESAKKINNKSYLGELFEQQEKNIKLCLKINNFEWFEMYIREINRTVSKNGDKEILENLYNMNENIGLCLLDEKKIYFDWFIKEIYNLNLSFKCLYDNVNFKYFTKLMTILLINDIEEHKGKNYETMKEVLNNFTQKITNIESNIQDVVIYYQLYGNEIIEKRNLNLVKDFINIITNENNGLTDDEKWNSFILYYLNVTANEWNELGKCNRKLIIEIILDLVLKDSNNNYFSFMPNYTKIIFDNRCSTNDINDICNEFEELLTRLAINNNSGMFYYVLKELKKAILNLETKDRLVQEKLFEICITILSRTVNIKNKKFIEITIGVIDDIVEQLDKDRKISDKFGKHIIEKISNIVISRSRIDENDAVSLICLLYGFIEDGKEYNFILSDNAKKKLLYKNIYNIGISCIENNKENAVRTVSNTLGWCIIRSINKDNSDLTKYIIDRTIDLYRIAENMQVSEKTLIFIMTLFTTVGTYCCKQANYKPYLDEIMKVLKNVDYMRIKTAIELRTNENTMWDNLYENNTKQLTKKFLEILKNETEDYTSIS